MVDPDGLISSNQTIQDEKTIVAILLFYFFTTSITFQNNDNM